MVNTWFSLSYCESRAICLMEKWPVARNSLIRNLHGRGGAQSSELFEQRLTTKQKAVRERSMRIECRK